MSQFSSAMGDYLSRLNPESASAVTEFFQPPERDSSGIPLVLISIYKTPPIQRKPILFE